MAGQLEPTVRKLMAAFDAKDFAGMLALATDDIEGVDEISKKWMRSKGDLQGYFDMLAGSVTDIRSTMSDIHERVWGDTGVATVWMEQSYKLEGNPVSVSVPMTIVCRNEGGWKVALVSAVPLPPEE